MGQQGARERSWGADPERQEQVDVDLTYDFFSGVTLNLPFTIIGHRQLHLRVNTDATKRSDRWSNGAKRSFDIVASFTGILILLPVLALIAAVIVATSRGPAIFKHERVGRDGERFKVWKFRSMREDANVVDLAAYVAADTKRVDSPAYKSPDDPRVTPIGKFLRKTGLDELPQLFNVLAGTMSLVGPRPLVDAEIDELNLLQLRHRNSVRPGITGLWQVFRSHETSFEERMRLDLLYVGARSFWVDLYLLLMTPLALIRGERSF